PNSKKALPQLEPTHSRPINTKSFTSSLTISSSSPSIKTSKEFGTNAYVSRRSSLQVQSRQRNPGYPNPGEVARREGGKPQAGSNLSPKIRDAKALWLPSPERGLVALRLDHGGLGGYSPTFEIFMLKWDF
ncbi:MAG: hypothetical protein Q9198_011259, partial [Flavoplaca austrocitrina]